MIKKIIFKELFHRFFPRKTTNGPKGRSWIEKIKAPTNQKWFIGVGTALLLTLLLSPSLQLPLKRYRAGDIATKEVKSIQDLLVEAQRSTQEKRGEAERSVLSVYDYDPGILIDAGNRLRTAFTSPAPPIKKGGGEPSSEFTLFRR